MSIQVKKILITGASGFIGTYLLKYLPKKNYHYTLIVKKKIIGLNKKYFDQIIIKNIFNFNLCSWIKILKNKHTVLHLAWYLNKNYQNSKKNFYCYKGTLNLAKASIKENVKRFIGIGTCAEYESSNKILDINSPLKSTNSYEHYKILTFLKLRILFKSKVKFVWLRPFFIYGQNQKTSQVIGAVLKNKSLNKITKINSYGNKIDYISVHQVCRDIVKILKKNSNRSIYNICTGRGFKIKDFLINKLKINKNLLMFIDMKVKKNDIIVTKNINH
mgnify:CR=1 FL=1